MVFSNIENFSMIIIIAACYQSNQHNVICCQEHWMEKKGFLYSSYPM